MLYSPQKVTESRAQIQKIPSEGGGGGGGRWWGRRWATFYLIHQRISKRAVHNSLEKQLDSSNCISRGVRTSTFKETYNHLWFLWGSGPPVSALVIRAWLSYMLKDRHSRQCVEIVQNWGNSLRRRLLWFMMHLCVGCTVGSIFRAIFCPGRHQNNVLLLQKVA